MSDNASSSETVEVLARFGDERIRHHRNEHDVGSYRNHVMALQLARGRYCAVMHDDTTWSPTFLERLVAPLTADPSLDLAFCDHWIADGVGQVQPELTDKFSQTFGRASLAPGRHQRLTAIALRRRSILLTAAVIRREIFASEELLDPRSGFVIDFYFFARIAQTGHAAFYVPDRLATYLIHGDSISATRQPEVTRDFLWACADLYGRASDREERRALQLTWAEAIANEAVKACRTRSWGRLPEVAMALWEVPTRARGQVGLASAANVTLSVGRALQRLSR